MRNRQSLNGLTVNTIAGTHVVFFGFDINPGLRKDFRGFAIQRLDRSNGEVIWMKSTKTFKKTEPNPPIGSTFSSEKYPFQSFQWADYSVHPSTDYRYTIHCKSGDPANLISTAQLEIDISTEGEFDKTHSVFFNRGSVATQEYARRFKNRNPDKVGQVAFDWLSRGLIEALITFLNKAKSGFTVYGAIYEFQWKSVLDFIKNASSNVKFKIIFDDVEQYGSDGKSKGPFKANEAAIKNAGITKYCIGRTNAKLMHNKFFVMCDDNDNPIRVWTGSTNLTKNGIFGHSNLGHEVEDAEIAKDFYEYWKRLKKDPEIKNPYRDENMKASPIPAELEPGTIVIFSPRGTKLDSLNWYARLAKGVQGGLFMTFAFGMHQLFKDIYSNNDSILKMALMDKAYSSPKIKAKEVAAIQKIRKRSNVVIAIGNRIITNSYDRWIHELSKIEKSVHVPWIHTKYMLIDPLGEQPIVASGSANFSKASTDTNDENMLVIKGDKRVADIYFGEFIRLYNHYAFREVLGWHQEKVEKTGKEDPWKPQYLIEDDSWLNDYFDPSDTTGRFKRREYFGGPISL